MEEKIMSTKLTALRVASLKEDTRTALLEAGMSIMLEKGYTNTGIQEVLSSLGIPKGSFYYYFESKEAFALAIIRHVDQANTADLVQILSDRKQTPMQRLRTYCEQGLQKIRSLECRKGCLIGNLSQEMSDQSEVLRKELANILSIQRNIFATCIAQGQELGEITPCCSAEKLAELFSSGWTGAMLRAKTIKNTVPLDTFIELMFNHFLVV